MRIFKIIRTAFIAAIALLAVGFQEAHADSGRIVLTIYKGGWVIGGTGGGGTLNFRGRTYRLSVGGSTTASSSEAPRRCCAVG